MEKITKCVNEWNATVEALGHGKQTILIRNYGTNLKKFILSPTSSYALKEDYINSFQDNYKSFVTKNAIPKRDGKKIEFKYFAVLEKIIEKPTHKIGGLKNYYIWSNDHVKAYLKDKKAIIWVLRVYKLNKPIISERTRGIKYANLVNEVILEGKPVLNDSKFNKIMGELK